MSNSQLSKLITSKYKTEPLDARPRSVVSRKSAQTITDRYFSTHIDHITSELLGRCKSDMKDEASSSSDYNTDETDMDDLDQDFIDQFSLEQPNVEKNYVLKICNQIKTFNFVGQERLEMEPSGAVFRQEEQASAPSGIEFPSEYFDKTFNQNFEYEYTEIMIDDFRKVLDRYDGSVSADAFIKKHLPSPEFLSDLVKQNKRSHSKQNIMDMYFVLKRMLTKKKYVEATIRMEKETKKNRIKRNMNSSSSLKSRPSTALISASDIPEAKEYRPRLVNLIPMKQMSQIDNEDNYDTIDDEINERFDTTANYHQCTDVAKSDYEFYYDPFKLDIQNAKQQWPFELEFDMEKKKLNRSIKTKCNTCKKLPSIKTDEKQTKQMSRVVREKSNVAANESKYMNPTFNSSSRCTSAKNSDPTITQTKKCTNFKGKTFNVMNNYSDEFNIDKRSKEDEDFKDLKENVRVNKEDHMRKMNILPGKSFRSQRRKSISIEHVPASQKKLETQKAKVLLTVHKIESKLNENCENEAIGNKNLDSNSSTSMESSLPKKKQYLALEHQEMFFMNGDYSKSQVCSTKMATKKNKKVTENKKTTIRPKTSKV